MDEINITDRGRLARILAVCGALDKARWELPTNYNLINYCAADLTPDEKLLTHWLCYIMDRQTPFMRIWDVGGYALSHLVREYRKRDVTALDLVISYLKVTHNDKVQVSFECPATPGNRRLERYGFTGEQVKFASRFMPQDVLLIFRTLALLDGVAGRSLGKFLATMLRGCLNHAQGIAVMAVALDGLTYGDAPQAAAAGLPDLLRTKNKWFTALAGKIVADPQKWVTERTRLFDRFNKKRLWCSLRDFLKSPDFNPHFITALRAAGLADPERWDRGNPELQRALDRLELPGDVWNNNPTFYGGLFAPYIANAPARPNTARTIRALYENMQEELEGRFYPEQLDITFDFVPRMCEANKCRVCPFGGGIRRMCHGVPGKLCPVSLATCGYEQTCDPATCILKADDALGHCAEATL